MNCILGQKYLFLLTSSRVMFIKFHDESEKLTLVQVKTEKTYNCISLP